jgi:glycosyltransferase involved in cell wall biosynthesis
MRVVVATDQWLPDVVGGSAAVARATAQHFARAGHEVTVVAPRANGRPAVERDEGVELHRSIRRTVLPQTISDVIETWRWAVRRPSPEVYVAHQATTAAGLLAAHPRVPLLYVFHASAPLEQRFLRRRLNPAGRIARILLDPLLVLLERLAVRRADTVAVLSEYSRGLLLGRHPSVRERVTLVRGGVDVDRFAGGDGPAAREAYGIPTDRPFLLTVRRLEPRMGVEELLRTVRTLFVRGTRLTLGIAGAGISAASLGELAHELELGEHVRFLGRVPDDDLPGLYAAADLFVLPTIAYEGFGISTIEALAAGTPVVGTAVGATPEILEPLDPRLVAPSADTGDLAASIERALGALSPTTRRRCADYARSRYRWDVAIESWEAALAKAASRAGGDPPAVPGTRVP